MLRVAASMMVLAQAIGSAAMADDSNSTGTTFDFAVGPDGLSTIAVLGGAIEICDRRRENCVLLEGDCSIASVGPNREPDLVETLEQRQQIIDDSFPFILDDRRLLSSFRVSSADCPVNRTGLPEETELPAIFPLAIPQIASPG